MNNGAYLRLSESEVFGQHLLRVKSSAIQMADGNYLSFCNLGFVVSLTQKASSLCQHVVNILSLGSKPKVIGSYADPSIAAMKNTHPDWNWSEVDNPGKSVRPNRVVVESELAVSRILEHGSVPNPTTALIWALDYSLPKALKNAIVDLHSLICAFGLQARRAFLF